MCIQSEGFDREKCVAKSRLAGKKTWAQLPRRVFRDDTHIIIKSMVYMWCGYVRIFKEEDSFINIQQVKVMFLVTTTVMGIP